MSKIDTESTPLTGTADVELRLPAEGAYVSVLRTTAAGLAARLDFTLEDIEDLRMAVGEAAALALEVAAADSDLVTRFWLATDRLGVSVLTTPADATATGVDEDSFGWQVLTALAPGTSVRATGQEVELTLTVTATPLGNAV